MYNYHTRKGQGHYKGTYPLANISQYIHTYTVLCSIREPYSYLSLFHKTLTNTNIADYYNSFEGDNSMA